MYSNIPEGSVVGINYNGMHDSAVAIISPSGDILFAASLERISRIKQDGRPPSLLLKDLPWNRVSKVAISTNEKFEYPTRSVSNLLTVKLPKIRYSALIHDKEFYNFIEAIPAEKAFVCHQMAHAASAFWGSGFHTALCLTYDGGMANSPWFGGLYKCDIESGITALDQFSALHYAKVTSLYTFVTALLGFTPNKHEGKITGLAALGTPTEECRTLLKKWFEIDFLKIESTMDWIFKYETNNFPELSVSDSKIAPFRVEAQNFSPEVLAATVQEFAEAHVIDILLRAKEHGWQYENICLAGGLFANVKINQRIAELGFRKVFIAPPMTDDGTAIGAAWHVLSSTPKFAPSKLKSVYLGYAYSPSATEELLTKESIQYERLLNPFNRIAELLANNKVVAVFQGSMEFGPRSLGNRSIIAQATRNDINQTLNQRLNRTEFMPFAPITRVEDAASCYFNIDSVAHAAEFMTVTVNCTDTMKSLCPAVVHVDGTARPQLVNIDANPFIHGILTSYAEITGRPSLVNTSFNIHEEPIVCSPEDAIQGFFQSGLDYLYFEGGYLINFEDNLSVAVNYLSKKIKAPSLRVYQKNAIISLLNSKINAYEIELQDKEAYIQNASKELFHLSKANKEMKIALGAYKLAYGSISPLGPIARMLRRSYEIASPRLGVLSQYAPRTLDLKQFENRKHKLSIFPKISIVTPSYQQGNYIERTIQSVLNQGYPNLEYYIQDGESQDQTVEVLKTYEDKLSGWVSEQDLGQSDAINRGFAKSTGEIMAWLNSDDLLLPGTLHLVAEYFANHPEIDVVYGNRILVDQEDNKIGRWILPRHDSELLSWADYVPQESLFWRRSIWNKVGGRIDESFSFAMDWDLLIRFRDAGAKFGHIPRFLGAFRIHENQKTSAAISEIGHKEMDRVRLHALGRIPSKIEIRKATLPFLIRHVFHDIFYRVKNRCGIIRQG